jgi:hypothetical protein
MLSAKQLHGFETSIISAAKLSHMLTASALIFLDCRMTSDLLMSLTSWVVHVSASPKAESQRKKVCRLDLSRVALPVSPSAGSSSFVLVTRVTKVTS